ncbi:MAG: D-aminoacyl-tRNA deacylase [Candidatus Sumerlaeaceae bacterium]
MKVILQRVREASVTVEGRTVGQIGEGLLLLGGIAAEDNEQSLRKMADKLINLRIFEDQAGKMNLSLLEVGGSILAVSQFTLFADCRKGRRPNFMGAAPPEAARQLFDRFVDILRESIPIVQTGVFQAMMEVRLNNWGPVTISLDTSELA